MHMKLATFKRVEVGPANRDAGGRWSTAAERVTYELRPGLAEIPMDAVLRGDVAV